MKILIDLTTLADNFSGIERFASSISYEMIKRKDMDYILLFKDHIDSHFKYLIDKQTNIETIILKRKNKLIFNQLSLPLAIRKIKADWYLFPAFPSPWLCFKKNIISAIHDLGCFDCPQVMGTLQKMYFQFSYFLAGKKSKKIVTVSNFSANRIIELLKRESKDIWIIYNGIEDKFYLDIDYKKEDYILSLSTLEPRKNLRLLIEAYNELILEKHFKAPLILVGRKGWKIDDLLENIDENVRKQITFTGFVDDDKLPEIYSKAKLFVFPSIYEGFGIPPLEAMACGTRVLSSNAASMPEILGENAEYFESNNKEDLKNKLLLMYQEKTNESTIVNAKAWAKKYNWSNEANKLINYIINTKQ